MAPAMTEDQGDTPTVQLSAKRLQDGPVRRSQRIKALKRPLSSPDHEEPIADEITVKPNNKRPRKVEPSCPRSVPPKTSTVRPRKQTRSRKKRAAVQKPQEFENQRSKSADPKQTPDDTQDRSDSGSYNPIAHWARNATWPPDLQEKGFTMTAPVSNKRRSSTSSSHRSETLARMAEHNVFMESSNLLQEESKELCYDLLKGDRTEVVTSIFTWEEFSKVLDEVAFRNERRVERDISPWVAPSAETLHLRGAIKIPWLREEVDQLWEWCLPISQTKKPKPDYAVGLGRNAFTPEEMEKLYNWAAPAHPFFVTGDITFPFFLCEVKSGEVGLNPAERQNSNSASVAVNTIIQLHKDAMGKTDPDTVKKLSGQVLVFAITHSNDTVKIYGHFAVFELDGPDQQPKFYRHLIESFNLKARDGGHRMKPYNFVVNVYEKFAPVHRQRIIDAVACFPSPTPQQAFVDTEMTSTTGGDGKMGPPPKPSSGTRMTVKQLHENFEVRDAQNRKESAERDAQQAKLIEQLQEDARRAQEDALKREAQFREEAAQREAQQTKLIEQLQGDAARRDAQLQMVLDQLVKKS